MERRDGAGGVSERISFAEMGGRPDELGGASLLRAPREGENAVEVGVSRDIQVWWGVGGLVEDVVCIECGWTGLLGIL